MNHKSILFKCAWFLFKANRYSTFSDALKYSWAVHKGMVITPESVENAYKEVSVSLKNWIEATKLYSTYSKTVSEDIVHDTFVKVLEKIHMFDPNKATMKTWIFGVCKNLIIDNSRSNMYKFNSKMQSIDAANDDAKIDVPDTNPKSDKSVYNAIVQTINGLNNTYKSVAILRFIHQKQLTEIAEELNMPLGTVKVTVKRCKEILQPKLIKLRIDS